MQTRIFAMFFCAITTLATAQLPAFSISAVAEPETCLGNGSLTVSASGLAPGAGVSYSIYLQPNTTTPIANISGNVLGGLFSGTYTIVATQSLAGETNTASIDITIPDQIVALDYTVDSLNAFCGNDGTIMVSVEAGNPVEYEVLSGPISIPIQSTPIFNDIPSGVYVIRVYDDCGEAMVVTHTVLSDATQVTAQPATFPDLELPSCDTITVSNTLTPSPNDALVYPLMLDYTIHPPDGSPDVNMSQTLLTGSTSSQEATIVIPFYYDQTYTYDLIVTDECGNTFSSTHTVNEKLLISLSSLRAECGQYYLSAAPVKYVGSYTLNFIAAPSGFNAAAFNSDYPGPFNIAEVAFGGLTNPVPFGDYTIEILDSCGRTAQASTTLTFVDPVPTYVGIPNPGCDGDMSQIEIALPGFEFISAIITIAPPAYSGTLPEDVTTHIDGMDGLLMDDMPAGDYHVTLTDDCGNVYEFDFTVLPSDPTVAISIRADCDSGIGSIRIRGNNTQLTSVIMTSAPTELGQTMPYDVSFNINASGIFSMAGFPAGSYSFTIVDSCNFTHTRTVSVPIYAVSTSAFDITPHCGAFDLNITYVANGFSSVMFWLQKYNSDNDTWGHPFTGAVYTNGTVPNAFNSVSLVNNSNNLNIQYTGEFRVVRMYESFGDGGTTGGFKSCVDIAHEFVFSGKIEITGVEKVTCDGLFSDVEVLTNGVAPIFYRIISKNNSNFIVDNGTNPVFEDLEPAIYVFEVSHSCGDKKVIETDVALLPSLATAFPAQELQQCDDSSNDGIGMFDLATQNTTILGTQNPALYTLTYHSTIEDAEAGVNALPMNYNSMDATVFARVSYNNSVDCYAVTSFNVTVKALPVLQMDTTYGLCEEQSVVLTADSGFDSYLWSTGETTRSITVTQSNSCSVAVTRDYGMISCSTTANITIELSTAPVISEILVTDWTDNENSITVVLTASSLGTNEFSLDNINFQLEPTFTGLLPGSYTVYVRNIHGCGFDQETVNLLNYPDFFTPNGDGFNEYWRVPSAELEPQLMTYIYDRYGKLITGFNADSQGWDGTLNGSRLPSTDYWFVVIREDGRHLKGHFSLKR